MNPGSLVIRTDASAAIGTGHTMRCLALAQAWQDAGGDVLFAFAETTVGLEPRILAERFRCLRIDAAPGSVQDAEATAIHAAKAGAKWVVVDGDRFSPEYLRALRAPDFRLLLIDDFAERDSFPADLILNSNLDARVDRYPQSGRNTGLLLGTRYVLLRREFTAHPRDRQHPAVGGRVLVSFGGTDPDNLSIRVMRALSRDVGFDPQITVVAGAGYPNVSRLQELSSPNMRVLVDPPNMPEIMANSDLAVIAAGGTLWELLYMGCAVLSYSRNSVQSRVICEVEQRGAARNLGDASAFDPDALRAAVASTAQSREHRETMAARGREVVDGLGAKRVVNAMLGEPE